METVLVRDGRRRNELTLQCELFKKKSIQKPSVQTYLRDEKENRQQAHAMCVWREGYFYPTFQGGGLGIWVLSVCVSIGSIEKNET